MANLDFPKLRHLSAERCDHQGSAYVRLEDPLGAFLHPVLVPIELFLLVVRHFDGRTTLAEIQARVLRETAQTIPLEIISRVVAQLDKALILEGPSFEVFLEAFRKAEIRPPAFAGRSYAAGAEDLRSQIARCFSASDGAGAPALPPLNAGRMAVNSDLRAILAPHIDYQRGGPVYTWAYRELIERSDAEVFVILGVAHKPCKNRFALSTKDFETPLGIVKTDRDYVERIAHEVGKDLHDDEFVHRAEHSIEFQAVFLQYLLAGRRDYKIVPILVGSFHDLMERRIDPFEDSGVRQFVEALRSVEVASGKKVVYIAGIDLCHVGPEFGDPSPVDPRFQQTIRSFDQRLLDHAAAGDPARWFATAAELGNCWRVCGLAATYTMLQTIGPVRGRLLRYEQALDDRRTCCVSFASMVFHSPEAPKSPPPHVADAKLFE